MLRIVAGKRDVYVDDKSDKPARHSESPPSIGIVVDAHLVQQRRRDIGPYNVQQERCRASQIQRESIIFICGDLRRRPRHQRRVSR